MTKAEFVEKYAEKTGMTKKDAANAVNAFFEVTADALKAGDKVVFPGTFKAEVTEKMMDNIGVTEGELIQQKYVSE